MPTSVGQATWAGTPERSNVFMMRVMTRLSLFLGRRAARAILHLISAYFLIFAPASRRASRSYLGLALGRPPHWLDIYRHFFTFASTIHDRVYLLNGRFDLFDVEVHGDAELLDLIAKRSGLFLLGAHLGSFEVIRALGQKYAGVRVVRVMYEDNAQRLNSTLAAINPDAVRDIVGLGRVDSMLRVRELLDDGAAVGVLADRTTGDDALFPVRILDTDTRLPSGPFRMAALLRRPVIFMTGLYLGGNRYAVHFEPIADFSKIADDQRGSAVEAAIYRYAELLDQYCREAPYNWFNFFSFWQPVPTPSVRD